MEILKSWLGNYDLLFFIINLCMRCLVINPLVRLLVGWSEIIFAGRNMGFASGFEKQRSHGDFF